MGILERIKNIFQAQTEQPSVMFRVVPKVKIYGTHGRLEIPELSISVPLYNAQGLDKQKLCDAKNSAVYMRWSAQDAIADHSDQANFSNLNRAVVGKTVASIDMKDSVQHFRCVRTQIGHIRITDAGNRIFDCNWGPAYYQNEGGLCIYTCIGKSAPDVMDVRLTYWQPFEAQPEQADSKGGEQRDKK